MLEQMAGLQAQYAPSMYVGLWSRLEGLEREALTRALERRSVVQGTLMRVTIHLVSARDYWPFVEAIREGRRKWWLRVGSGDPSAREMAAAAKRLRRRFGDGPLRKAEIEEVVGKGARGANGVGVWLDMVRVPPAGTWERRRADLYAAAEDWLGPSNLTPEEGLEHLVRRYLRGFGPAAPGDIANWAGLPIGQVAPVLERIGPRHFRDQDGTELVDLPRAPIPDPEARAPVRFLPVWDATMLVHARRTGVLSEEHRPRIFNTRTPHSVSTFLVDGAVAGTWKYDGDRVRPEPFGRLSQSTRRELRDEAECLTEFHR
jgi:hypothetical protein